MSIDILIVGSGLTGLFAANLASDQGFSVHIISAGQGGLSLSHGCISLFHTSNPSRSMKSLSPDHPYRIVPSKTNLPAIRAFKSFMQDESLKYHGGISSSIQLISATGNPFRASLVPDTMIKGRVDRVKSLSVAGLEGFRDFWPELMAQGSKSYGLKVKSIGTLPLLLHEFRRDFYASDIANSLEDPSYRDELWRAWKPKLTGERRVGIPAIFGYLNAEDHLAEAESVLGVELFEIPSLPPSLPGLRMEKALLIRAKKTGVTVTMGPIAQGRIDGRSKGKRTAGVQYQSAGGPRSLDAKMVLLATGGFLHGGLIALQSGQIAESVFGIPVKVKKDRTEWTNLRMAKPQGFARFGLKVDRWMRPLAPDGKPFLENLFAAGGILAGADRTLEGSRQGIDLITAYHAVERIADLLE